MLGSSDGQMLEFISDQISDQQLFGSAARGLTGQMVEGKRKDDEKNDWKKFPHAQA